LPFLKKRERKLSKDLLSRKFTFPFPYEKIKDALNLNKTLKHQLVIFFKHLSKRIKSLFFVLYNRLKIHKTWQAQI